MPNFLRSYRELIVRLSQNCQTEIVGQQPQHFFTQKLSATSTKLKINMQRNMACCLQKYNLRHIFACG
jgi:light-regulated signal transduction histidine kinase (bacteriophytochrome)